MKSTPIPTIDSFGTPAAASACGTAFSIDAIQSPGCCSAQSAASRTPESGSAVSITPCGYSTTAEPRSFPVRVSTTSARTDAVPKSSPSAQGACGSAHARYFAAWCRSSDCSGSPHRLTCMPSARAIEAFRTSARLAVVASGA